ncbi:MAG: metallophosphoesterase family protein [Mycobacteriales bacterium]
MKFLHCADVHLDSPLRGLARYEGAPLEALRGATRRAFERLVALAIEEEVAFVVIAGDLYDGDRDDFQTAMFLQRQLHVLREAAIPVVICYGNHDAASEITKRLALPEGVHALPHEAPATVELAAAGAALHGRSYPSRAVSEDLSLDYPVPVPGVLNVGVLHTSLDGRPGHDPYAPCTLDGLASRGYAYWALGHVHQREQHQRDGVHVVFPGNIAGRDVGEAGSKGATTVVYDGEQVLSVTHRDLAPVRWSRLELDLADVVTVDGVLESAVTALADLQAAVPAELHAVRVVAQAGPAAARAWLCDPERYEAQLRADAAGQGETLWLERVEVRPTAAPRDEVPGEALGAVRDLLAALRADPAGRARILGPLAVLRTRFGPALPEVVRLGVPGLDEASADRLLDDVETLLEAELGGSG